MLSPWKQKALLSAVIIAVVYYALVLNNLDYINSLSPTTQFLVVTVSMYATASYFLGYKHRGLKGFIGALCVFMAVDIIIPPLMVSHDGTIVESVDIAGASADVFVAKLWESVGIHGEMLWYFTYLVSFVILMAIGIVLLRKKAFRSAVASGL